MQSIKSSNNTVGADIWGCPINTTEIAAVHPLASMMAVKNPALGPLTMEVTDKLKNAMNSL